MQVCFTIPWTFSLLPILTQADGIVYVSEVDTIQHASPSMLELQSSPKATIHRDLHFFLEWLGQGCGPTDGEQVTGVSG